MKSLDDCLIIENFQISINRDFLKNKGFSVILAYDLFRAVEADWLVNAIKSELTSSDRLLGYSFEKKEEFSKELIPIERDQLLKYVQINSIHHSVLTNEQHNFLAYFSQHRDFYIIAGTSKFLNIANPVSPDTVKYQYFENVSLEAQRMPVDEKYFHGLWEYYKANHFKGSDT